MKSRTAFMVAGAWLFGMCAQGKNRMVNGGFEQGRGADIPGWQALGWGQAPVLDRTVKHSGRASLRVSGYGGARSRLYSYPGGRVLVAGWMKTRAVVRGTHPWNKAAFQVVSYDAHRKPVGHSDVALLDGAHEWTRFSAEFRYSKSVAFVAVHCHLWGKKTRGTAWFDDITLEMPDPPAPPRKLDLAAVTVAVDFGGDLGAFRHLWIGSDVGYMDRVTSSTQINAMRFARRFGFRYIRMHDCIHDPHIYSEKPDGSPVYTWTAFDARVAAVVNNGMRPIIVLETMPPPLAGRDDGVGWKNPYPPKDPAAYRKWQELIRTLVAHCRKTWGPAIHDWYFEVWNEPDSRGYFKGSQADYFKIYDHAVAGAVAADPDIRIGGPAGAGVGWIRDFLAHCRAGRNDATGGRGCRVDFLSWHIYTVGVGVPVFDNLRRSLETVRGILNAFPEYRRLPTVITEWGCSSSPFAMHDRPYDAAFRVMAVREFMDYHVTYAFPFALGAGPPHVHEGFQGGLAMFTKTTIPKPSFVAFELLDRMHGRRVPCRSSSDPVGGLACMAPDGAAAWVLLYNVIENYRHPPYTTQVTVRLRNLPPGAWRCTATRVAPGVCDPQPVWRRMGSPEKLTKPQRAALLAAAEPPPPRTVPIHGHAVRVRMDGFSIMLLELRKE